MDLYKLLGVEPTASISEIRKAYRQKALKYHPNKNPDNLRATKLFRKLSKAVKTLTDPNARAAYDKTVAARKRRKDIKKLDAKGKKFKDLRALQEEYLRLFEKFRGQKRANARLQKWLFKKIQEVLPHQIIQPKKGFLIQISWKIKKNNPTNDGYTYDDLNKIFSKYGDITGLALSSKKKDTAIVRFQNKNAAKTALLEIGLANKPTLTLRPLWVNKCSCSCCERRA